jgi:hypothetical protein
MAVRIDRYMKAVLTVIAACLLWQCLLTLGQADVQAQTAVFSDQQLLGLARDTYERARGGAESDWMYAALHINALLQRNTAAVQNNPAFAKQLAEGQAYAGRRIQAWLKVAEQATPQVREAAGRELGILPSIRWPSPQ